MEKETVTFTAELNKPDQPFKFLKDGVEVDLKDGYEVKSDGNKYTLTVVKTRLDQQAEYTFEVEGASCTANLIVDGKLFSIVCLWN